MKTKKLSFSEISGVMSRSEMKKIMAGSGGAPGGGCSYTFAQGQQATCPPGATPAGCKSLGSGKYDPYCYFDSSGTCYSSGTGSCQQI